MNKVVAVLAVIVVITLGILFFFAGFYMGNTTTFGKTSTTENETTQDSNGKKLTLQDINAQIAAQSNNISDKVMKIISGGADNISNSVSRVVTRISHQKASQMSADSLLKEIMASHSEHDDCSAETTEKNLRSATQYDKDSLRGKKVVFIGYFKDNVALQIQQLLIDKGYKVHVEESKTCPGESFIFSGPFKKKENAEKLVTWLKDHDFSEAKMVNIIQESVEKAIADTMDDDSTIPENEEEEIPEVNQEQLQNLADNASRPAPSQNAVTTVNITPATALQQAEQSPLTSQAGLSAASQQIRQTPSANQASLPAASLQTRLPLANQLRNLQTNPAVMNNAAIRK